MTFRKKILFWSAGIVGLALLLLVAALYVTPLYLNNPAVKTKIESVVSRGLGGSVSYEQMNISFFPRPRAVIRHVTLSVPGVVSGTVSSISVSLRRFPFREGIALVSQVAVDGPDIDIIVPRTAQEEKAGPERGVKAKDLIRSSLSAVETFGPGVVVEIERGALAVIQEGRPVYVLRNITARLTAPPGEQNFSFRASIKDRGLVTMEGRYHVDEETAGLDGFSASLGRSSVSGISARILFSSPFRLEILSGRARLPVSELHRFLSSSAIGITLLKNITSLEGVLDISSLEVSGPLLRPVQWRFSISGRATGVVVGADLLPASLSLSGRFLAEQDRLTLDGASASLGKASLDAVSARLFWKRRAFEVLSGRAAADLEEIFQWRSAYRFLREALKGVRTLTGTVRLSSMKMEGTFPKPASWKIDVAGSVERVHLDMPFFAGPAAVRQGRFRIEHGRVSLSGFQVSMLDAAASLSGVLNGLRGGIRSAELALEGTAGRRSVAWAYEKASLPREFMVSAPLTFSAVHLSWRKKGNVSLAGALISANGPALAFDFLFGAAEFTVQRATLTDRGTNATVTLKRREKTIKLTFSGRLAEATLDRVLERKTSGTGTIRGDFSATIVPARPLELIGRGRLEGNDIVIPWGLSVPVTIDSIAVEADGGIFTISSAALTGADGHYSVFGNVVTSVGGLVLDLDVSADRINVAEIQKALGPRQPGDRQAGPRTVHGERPVVLGSVRIKTPSLAFGHYIFSPVDATATLAPDKISLVFNKSGTCGLSLPGTLVFSRQEVRFAFKAAAAGQGLDSSLDCLAGKDFQITGRFDLTADVRASGKPGTLVSLLEGSVNFTSKKGKIYRYPLLAKIFSVLSVTEILRGKIPELGGSGFPYKSLTIKGEIHHGVLRLEQAHLSGSSLDLIADGDVDLAGKTINLTVLVAPFSTLNWIIGHIPIIGKVLGGTLISVPVKVSGDIADPDVAFLAPSAVGERLIKLLENILAIPVEIISPILPRGR